MTKPKQATGLTLATSLRALDVEGIELAFVLGSGLGVFAERLADARTIPYADIEGMPQSAVPGHAGCLVTGTVAGKRVLVQQGRVHLYEGWSAHDVTLAVRAFAELGCKGVVLTNAAGGLRPEWKPGTLMRLTDHINLQGRSPLENAERGFGSPYDPALGAALEEGAEQAGFELTSGVYAALLGPTYETPAEVRMLRWMGADAVGMSTAAEALAAHAAGMRVAAVSCITNQAAGISGAALSHQEVIDTGRAVAQNFCALLERAVPHLVGELTD
jgi:purine-nucleoside phosphorylase